MYLYYYFRFQLQLQPDRLSSGLIMMLLFMKFQISEWQIHSLGYFVPGYLVYFYTWISFRCHWQSVLVLRTHIWTHFLPVLHCSFVLSAPQGLEYCHVFCHVCFFPRLQDFIMNQDWNDPKSKLQQCCLTLRTMEGGEPDIPVYKYVQTQGSKHTEISLICTPT